MPDGEEQGTETPTEETPTEEQAPDAAALKAEADKWKAMARKHEARAKSNEDKAKRVDELESASKTEVERLTDKAKADAARADAAEARATRYEVALDKGVPTNLLKFITGDSREDMEEAADELLDAIGQPGTGSEGGTTVGGKPKEALKAGASSTEEPEETDPAKLAEAIPRGY